MWITRNGTVKIQDTGQKIKIFYNGWGYGNCGNTQKSQNKVNDWDINFQMGMFCYGKMEMCVVVICKGFSSRVSENICGRQIILKFGGGGDVEVMANRILEE